ncbi:MAG: SixA phosphatase family protein [Allosphingosinicella sp.]|uniref:SixA phosphatase family protein n=1 Tax=Allosphingosinicella sp. TaxID=2823234 RepID=UPI00392CC6B1
MKILTLLRHAKSGWDDPVERDFDRPLNGRGRRAARTVGAKMRALGLRFDQVVASPAVRVVETLADLSEGYGAPIRPYYDERAYLASAATLIDIIHEADETAERLLIVGHNPGLETLALLLSREGGEARAEIAVKYPTAALVEIGLPVDSWRDVTEGTGTIARLLRPRDLDPELGPDEDSF